MTSYERDTGKSGFSGRLFQLRWQMKHLSQGAFAERFGLSFSMVRDQEQGRVKPSRAFQVLVAAIELDPALIERAAKLAKERAAE